MAMVLQDMDNDSRSQSVASDVNESDHNEVHNTYKHRGKVLIRWKRLVKVNSLIYLLFGWVWLAYIIMFSPVKHKHNYAIPWIAIFASLWGLITGFSFKDPSSTKIYINAVVTGLACGVICFYTIIGLSKVVIQSVDDEYKNQFDNFVMKEVSKHPDIWISFLQYKSLSLEERYSRQPK